MDGWWVKVFVYYNCDILQLQTMLFGTIHPQNINPASSDSLLAFAIVTVVLPLLFVITTSFYFSFTIVIDFKMLLSNIVSRTASFITIDYSTNVSFFDLRL